MMGAVMMTEVELARRCALLELSCMFSFLEAGRSEPEVRRKCTLFVGVCGASIDDLLMRSPIESEEIRSKDKELDGETEREAMISRSCETKKY